jgi:hypothetical protein
VETGRFADEIARLKDADYVIVALGDDERNLRTAVNLRTLFARIGAHPRIQTIVYNSDEKESLQKVRNFEASSYDIEFFGDLRSAYCEDVIINSELEEKALALHCSWFGEQKRQQLREEILAETKGLPEELLRENLSRCIRIPMLPTLRCLNLSNAVAVAVYEVLRQTGFSDMETVGSL